MLPFAGVFLVSGPTNQDRGGARFLAVSVVCIVSYIIDTRDVFQSKKSNGTTIHRRAMSLFYTARRDLL